MKLKKYAGYCWWCRAIKPTDGRDINHYAGAGERIISITHALAELENVTQSNAIMVDELSDSSDILKNQVTDLQSRTHKFRLSHAFESERRQRA